MRDYTKEIAEKIQRGKEVVIFSVGGDSLNVLRALKQRFDILPTAICDNDKSKQNRTFKGLYEMVVFSPQVAVEKYPNAYWFIATLDYKYEIIGELIEKYKINSEYIINYEPVVLRKSCSHIEKSMVCNELREFSFCCFQPRELKYILFNGSYDESIQEFCKLRDETIENYKGECGECVFWKQKYVPVERKVRWINYGVGGVCNFNCIYCTSNARMIKEIDKDVPKLPEIIEHLKNNDLIAEDYGINIAPGEPTVHPERDRIFDTLNCYSNVVNTNLGVFNEKLYKIMAEKFTKLVVSIDSGTRETFKKVKGIDLWDNVCENLKRYSSAGVGIIVLKYVFVPGINDSDEDVDGFVQVCKDTGCLIGNISYDYFAPLPIPEKTLKAMKKLKDKLLENDILSTSNIVFSPSEYIQELKKIN